MRPLIALAALALLVPAAPAAAETWSAPDRTRDVHEALVPTDPADCETEDSRRPTDRARDVTRLSVDHDDTAVAVSVAMRRLAVRRTSWVIHVRTPRHDYAVLVTPFGGLSATLLPVPSDVEPAPGDCGLLVAGAEVPCEALDVGTARAERALTVTVPRGCLGDPAWVRVGADAAWKAVYDRWTPRVERDPDAFAVYGPRVRAAR